MKWYHYILALLCCVLCSCSTQKTSTNTKRLQQESIEKLQINTTSRDTLKINGVLTVKIKRVVETFEMDSATHQPYVKTREIEETEATEQKDVEQNTVTESHVSDTTTLSTDEQSESSDTFSQEEEAASKVFKGIGNGIFALLTILAISVGVTFFWRYKK